MNENPSQPLVKRSNHDAGCAPPPGRDLRRISRWLGWACWLALGVFVAVALINRELVWDQWRAQLHYPGWGLCLAVLAYGMVSAFGLFRSTSVSSASAGFFAIGAIVQLFNLLDWSHDPKDMESLHKAAVMMSIYTVVLALMYGRSGARHSADAKSASEIAPTNQSLDEN